MWISRRLFVGLVASCLLGACSWFSSNEHPIPELTWPKDLKILKARWDIRVSEDLLPLTPGFASDVVYAVRSNGEVRALKAQNGSELWKINVKAPLSGGAGAVDGYVVVGTRAGELVVLDEDGKERWRKSTGGNEITSSPVIGNGMVVARSLDGKLAGLTLREGIKRWGLERTQPALTLYRSHGAVASRGALFAAMPGGKVVALAIEAGNVGWETAVALPKGATELDRVSDVTGVPIVGEHDVCAGTYQGRVACIDAATGNLLWSREASTAAGVGGDPGRVYVADEKGVVSAFDRASGTPAWKNDQFLGRRLIGSTAAAGYVVVGDFQGYVQWLNREDGKLVARGETDGTPIVAAPIFIGNGVLVQTRKGGLFVFPNP